MTELADLKMAGALAAVDGVAQVDSGAVTADEAIKRVLDARIALRNHGARSLPGNVLASVDRRRVWWSGGPGRASGDVDAGEPSESVGRLAGLVPLPRSARQGKARTARAIFPSPAARW